MIKKDSLFDIPKNRKVLIQGERFSYILPCEQLRSWISNFTISFPDKTMISDNYTIMPHGSVTLVLFYYHSELYSFFFGPTTRPVKVGDIANQCDILFIVEFQPAGLYPFIQKNQKELADQIVPFSWMDHSLDQIIRNIFRSSLSVDELLLEFENVLIQKIQFQYREELTSAIHAIIEMEGAATALEISKDTFYCSRHLNRLFNQYVGMSIKSFSRLVRINKSIRLLSEKENTLAIVCEKLGYYDVSHFIKDFKIVCGITPQDYRMNMSDFYSEIAKY